ncbi:MAG: lamin tail domain-containing protein [Planctomycetota bacterium]
MRFLFLATSALSMLAGAAHGQELGPVVITEIMYNPPGTDEGQEWVEIYNPTAAPVDLSRWSLITPGGRTADIPSGTTLASHAVAIIAPRRGGLLGSPSTRRSTYVATQASWDQAWGPGIRVIFVESFWNYPSDPVPVTGTIEGLGNTGDTLQLVDRQREVVDEVAYDTDDTAETPWPDGNDSGSIQLLRDFVVGPSPIADNNTGAAWRRSGPGDGLGSRLAGNALPAFPGLDSYGSPGALPNQQTLDCNTNGINDAVDIVRGTALDSYPYNNIPDSCEGDCNANALPDLTEILLDWHNDRNANRVIDSCEINAHGGASGVGGAWDANTNGILDSFENKPNVVITEIMYDPNGDDAGKEFVEIFNSGVTAIDISGWALRDIEGDARTGLIPAGTIMQPQEVIVLSAASGPGVPADVVTQFRIAWNLPAGVRVFGLGSWQDRAQRATPIEEVLSLVDAANEPVDVVNYENPSYSPATLWPADDTASSISLLPTALSKAANDLGLNWVRSTTHIDGAYDSISTGFFSDIRGTGSAGSPGIVWTATHQLPTGEAAITEIMFHPNSNPGDPSRGEWLELYNPGPTPLDVSGWYIRDEDGRTGPIAPGTVLASHQVLVLIPQFGAATALQAESEFRAAWGNICNVAALTGWSDLETSPNIGGLANNPGRGNECLSVRKADATVVDVVNYDDANGWPVDAVNASPGLGTAWSIELLPGHCNATDNDLPVNWAASLQGINLADLNIMTLVFNGFDIGSPGLLEGIVTTRECSTAPCSADFDADGTVDFFDYDAFVNCFEGIACPPGKTSDFDADGTTDFFDYDAFVVAFEAGC